MCKPLLLPLPPFRVYVEYCCQCVAHAVHAIHAFRHYRLLTSLQLTRLDVSANAIGDAGADAIATIVAKSSSVCKRRLRSPHACACVCPTCDCVHAVAGARPPRMRHP